jgi:hypothetical protein
MNWPPIINAYLAFAGGLSIIVGLVHSILGETLIFSGLRQGGIVPTGATSSLRERQVRILWATWHLPTIFSFLMGAILIQFGLSPAQPEAHRFVVQGIITSAGLSSFIVLIATNGKHPGWVGLLAIALAAWLGLP